MLLQRRKIAFSNGSNYLHNSHFKKLKLKQNWRPRKLQSSFRQLIKLSVTRGGGYGLLSAEMIITITLREVCTFPVSRDWSFFCPVFRYFEKKKVRYYGISSSFSDGKLPYKLAHHFGILTISQLSSGVSVRTTLKIPSIITNFGVKG